MKERKPSSTKGFSLSAHLYANSSSWICIKETQHEAAKDREKGFWRLCEGSRARRQPNFLEASLQRAVFSEERERDDVFMRYTVVVESLVIWSAELLDDEKRPFFIYREALWYKRELRDRNK